MYSIYKTIQQQMAIMQQVAQLSKFLRSQTNFLNSLSALLGKLSSSCGLHYYQTFTIKVMVNYFILKILNYIPHNPWFCFPSMQCKYFIKEARKVSFQICILTILKLARFLNNSIFVFVKQNCSEMEVTLDCKLHWFPKFYQHDLKIWGFLLNLDQIVSKLFPQLFLSREGKRLIIVMSNFLNLYQKII